MNQGKYVFAQLTDFLPQRVFDRLVAKYDGNKHVRHFSCWNQLLSMIFGQLTGRDSLRDLMVSIEPHKSKYYHLGFGKGTSRSNFANANEKRDCKIFEEYAFHLIDMARKTSFVEKDFLLVIDGNVYAFDSTTIDLCLNVFWWATFRKTKGGIKLHTLYDIKTSIPSFIHVSTASVNDMNALDLLYYEPGAYNVLDRGYIDYKRLFRIHQSSAYFVVRAKKNLQYRIIYSRKVNKDNGVLLDQTGRLTGFYTAKEYPEKLRRIKFYDEETDNHLMFLSNNFNLTAEEIAQLYKYRWNVGVSREGHIIKSVKVRPRIRDSNLEAWEASWRETKAVKPSDTIFVMENKQHYRLQRTVNAEVASLHESPVAETVDNVRRQQGLLETGMIRQSSPAGYQRLHVVKDYVETGEALDTRRRNIVEEAHPITLNGKWTGRYQGGGLGRSTEDRCAAKRTGREGPRLVSIPFDQSEAGVR